MTTSSYLRRHLPTILLLVNVVILPNNFAHGHGGLGHIQVTAWAAENLPPGELRSFLANEDIFNALLFGAAYPDIGYYPFLEYPEIASQFAEYTHWPPFMEQFIEWIRVNDPPPWNTMESKKRIGFLLGCAAHGFQDEVFDTLFLPQIRHHDNQGQNEADPASDGLLVRDALITDVPYEYLPTETLLTLYNESGAFEIEVTKEILSSSVQGITTYYIHEEIGPDIATVAWEQLASKLPWMSAHYMDPDIPGSLRAEIFPTMRYLEAVWKRLHNKLSNQDMVIFSFPEEPRRLRSYQKGLADNWVSLMFAAGIDMNDLSGTWTSQTGNSVPLSLKGNAWSDQWPRIIRVVPEENLSPGEYYRVNLAGQPTTINEKRWSIDHTLSFQVACTDSNLADCPDLEEIQLARIDAGDEFKNEWETITEPVSAEERGCGGCSAATLPSTIFLWFALIASQRYRLKKKSRQRVQ